MENQTVTQKLEALVKLQSIDTKLDELKKLRGDLPDEVQDLEDEMEGYKTRLGRFEPVTLLAGAPTFFFRDVLMASAWGLNLLFAEWIIRRRLPSA